MTKLTEFRKRVIDHIGISRKNRYVVIMGKVPGLDSKFSQDLMFFCEGSQLPSKSFGSNPHRMYGETREIPYEKLFTELNLSFYMDNAYKVKDFFEGWQGLIQNRGSRRFDYWQNYTTTVEIIILDVAEKPRYRTRFNEVYVKEVGTLGYSYADNAIQTLPIKLAFRNENYGGAEGIRENDSNAPLTSEVLSSYTGDFSEFQKRADNPFRRLLDGAFVDLLRREADPIQTDLGDIKFYF